MLPQLLCTGDSAAIHSYTLVSNPTTFDSAKKSASITLSNGNLTASAGASAQGGVKSVLGVSTGRYYWEITCGAAGFDHWIGVATSGGTLVLLGYDAGGWAYRSHFGTKHNNSSAGVAYGSTFTTGDVIGVDLDMGAGTLSFRKNNVSQGTAFTGITGTVYAAISLNTSGADTLTANFGGTWFKYDPPTGATAGLGT